MPANVETPAAATPTARVESPNLNQGLRRWLDAEAQSSVRSALVELDAELDAAVDASRRVRLRARAYTAHTPRLRRFGSAALAAWRRQIFDSAAFERDVRLARAEAVRQGARYRATASDLAAEEKTPREGGTP